MEKKRLSFLRLYTLHGGFVAADTFGWALGFLYLYKHGIPMLWLLIFFLLQYGAIYLVIANSHKYSIRHLFVFSFCLRILALIILSTLIAPYLVYLIGLLQGLAIFAYWVPFNSIYFKLQTEKNRTFMTAVYAGITSLLSLLLPPIAGYVAQQFGYTAVFLASVVLMFIPLCISFTMPHHELEFDPASAAARHKKLRSILLVQGIFDTISLAAIPLFVLLFIDSEIQLGFFLSYIGLAGVAGSFILAKIADKHHTRKVFVYPLTILLGTLLILLGFSAGNFYLFLVVSGLLSTVTVLMAPFFVTMVFDNYRNVTEAVIAREMMLALGRVVGMLVLIVSFAVLKTPAYGFIAIGLVTWLYPYLVYKKGIYAH